MLISGTFLTALKQCIAVVPACRTYVCFPVTVYWQGLHVNNSFTCPNAEKSYVIFSRNIVYLNILKGSWEGLNFGAQVSNSWQPQAKAWSQNNFRVSKTRSRLFMPRTLQGTNENIFFSDCPSDSKKPKLGKLMDLGLKPKWVFG